MKKDLGDTLLLRPLRLSSNISRMLSIPAAEQLFYISIDAPVL